MVFKVFDALWTFVRVEGVEPTNNTAERSIRLGVLWRKGSFGTQSADGSRFVEAMMTAGGNAQAAAPQRPLVYDGCVSGGIRWGACPIPPPASLH